MKDTTSTKENFDEFDEFSDEDFNEFMDDINKDTPSLEETMKGMSAEQKNEYLKELFENFGTKKGEKTAKKSKSSAEGPNEAELKKMAKEMATRELNEIKDKVAKLEAKSPSVIGIFFTNLFVNFIANVFYLVLAGIAILIFSVMMTKNSDSSEESYLFVAIAILIAILAALGRWIYKTIIGTKDEIKQNKKVIQQEIEREKEQTTCPSCKKSLVWCAMRGGEEVLSKDYKTKEIREGFGKNAYMRNGVFVYGTKKVFWAGICIECEYEKFWEEVKKYEQEV